MYKIHVSLGNVEAAIKELETYEKKIKKNIEELLSKLLDYGIEIASAKIVELNAVESGDLLRSLDRMLYKEGNKGIIFTNSIYACYVEFGTGIKGANKPHPTKPWAYDINGHGDNGWWYPDETLGRARFTKGMPSRPFMYQTAQELEKQAVKIAKEVFSR